MNKIYFILCSIFFCVYAIYAQNILFITDAINTYQELPIEYIIKGLHFRKHTIHLYCRSHLKFQNNNQHINTVLQKLLLTEFPADLGQYSTIICANMRIAKEYIYLKELPGNQNKRFITIVRGDDFTVTDYFSSDMMKKVSDLGDLFLVTSQHTLYLLDLCNFAAEKLQLFHLPIDCTKSTMQINIVDQKKEVKILIIDEFPSDSGIETACKALNMLTNVKFNCTVVCSDRKAARLKTLYQSRRINFIKVQSSAEFLSLFKQHHMLIMTPSTSVKGIRKGIPVSVLEAMAHGLLVIASRHGGISEVIKNNENGYIVPEQDYEALAATIKTAMSERQTWVSKILRSREIILERHERVNVMRKLHALLNQSHTL